MTSYFQGLVEFVGAHPQLSFFAVFLLALSEAIPVVGTVVPGSTLILAVSALATTAGMSPWALLIAAAAGAIVGDGFSFWLGHNYRRQILRGWPLNRFPWLVDRSAQSIRNFKIKNPCRLEIDNEFKLGRLFDREVSGLVALRIGVRAVVREGRLHSRAYMGSFRLRGLTWFRI